MKQSTEVDLQFSHGEISDCDNLQLRFLKILVSTTEKKK
jgi:hypothetical protein